MTLAARILSQLFAAGIRLQVKDGQLVWRTVRKRAMTPELLGILRDHKDKVLELLDWLQQASAEIDRNQAQERVPGSVPGAGGSPAGGKT